MRDFRTRRKWRAAWLHILIAQEVHSLARRAYRRNPCQDLLRSHAHLSLQEHHTHGAIPDRRTAPHQFPLLHFALQEEEFALIAAPVLMEYNSHREKRCSIHDNARQF